MYRKIFDARAALNRALVLTALLAALCLPAFAQETPWKNSTIVGAAQGYNPRLADDFYAAVNHDWLVAAKIPQGYPNSNSFTERKIQVNKELLDLMTNKSLQGRDAQNVQNLYALFLDWETRKTGIEELKKIVGRVEKIKTIKELADYLASDDCIYNGNTLCNFYVGKDANDSFRSALEIYPTSLSLDDSAEYKKLSDNGKNTKEFRDSVALFVLQKLGYGAAAAKEIIARKYQFESALATSIMTEEDCSSPDYLKKTLNQKSVQELQELSPNYPLVQIMARRGMDKAKKIYLAEPAWLKKINELFVQDNFENVKACIIESIARSAAMFLDKDTYDFFNAAADKRFGVAEAQSLEQDACDFVSDIISVPLSKLYAKYCVDKKAKSRVTKIIKEIIAEYRIMINSQDWLCDATKKKAIEKINATKIHVAYPVLWDNYSALDIRSAAEGESIFTAVQKIDAFFINKTNKQVNKNHGSGMWNSKVYQVNAFNSHLNNSINIIAGILGGAFYRPDMKDEELYATLGAVIGHEISHSFDAGGSQFDKHGAMKNWWTEEDYAAFQKRTQKIADYFDSMNTLGNERQSGKTLQGEAAADIGGIKVMLALAKNKDGFDYDLFFKTYARLWASVSQKQFADWRLKTDVHPFDYLRVNVTIQQFDEFYKTYGIKPGDKMYLAPEKRIGIW